MSKAKPLINRVRPSDSDWPTEAVWDRLRRDVAGNLVKVPSPFAELAGLPRGRDDCEKFFRKLKNPYYLGDESGLTQTLGWVGAWTSQPSVYAVAAGSAEDIVAAINFAREHRLRLVIKGGGHSYQGTSNAPDSLLIWMRNMNRIKLHEMFVCAGCEDQATATPAVSVEAGAIWGQVYDAVVGKAGRYVQGGGCLTVGVAGLVQSGGFGSFSKAYGLACGSLLEAEIVTADGTVRTVNRQMEPDLFWGIKGGGGGSLGVITRLTLRTHPLPNFFGRVQGTIRAKSDEAFRELIRKVVCFYREALFNPHWGEQIALRSGKILDFNMVFQALDQKEAEDIWRPLLDWVAASSNHLALVNPIRILAAPARLRWDSEYLKQIGLVLQDDRPGASPAHVYWAGNQEETGMVLHAYQSAWIPASLLQPDRQEALVSSLFAAAKHWEVVLHTNKGLAGGTPEAIATARDTAMNPAVADAFALLICANAEQPAYPGIPGHEPDVVTAREHARAVERAMKEIRGLVPMAGSYVAESDYFEAEWQRSFWGPNYQRLLAIKERYDPEGLFFVHHGVGAERWSLDGFRKIS